MRPAINASHHFSLSQSEECGPGVARVLLEQWRGLKVVMFTNSAAEVDRRFAESLNAGFITKPTSMDGIREVTERLLKLCE